MRTFFDSSALAKRYVAEAGTEKVLLLCQEAKEIILAVIAVPELVSAFNRLRREGALNEHPQGRACCRYGGGPHRGPDPGGGP